MSSLNPRCPHLIKERCGLIECIKCHKMLCMHDDEEFLPCISPLNCSECGKITMKNGRHETIHSQHRYKNGKWQSWCSTECYENYKKKQ